MKNGKNKGIIYQEVKPTIQLASFIKSFWYFENSTNEIQSYSILPDGCFDLLLYFKEKVGTKMALTGLWDKNVDVSIPAKTEILAIRFKPLAAEYIFERSLVGLLNSMTAISKKEIVLLPKFSTGYQSFEVFVASNTIALQSILETKKALDLRKKKVFDLLFEYQGSISIKEISEQAIWSNRQISRYFRENYGISTKKYANILRINSTYKDLANGVQNPQTAYFDQSHFIKEVKKYTGENPKTLVENKNDRFLQLSPKKKD